MTKPTLSGILSLVNIAANKKQKNVDNEDQI